MLIVINLDGSKMWLSFVRKYFFFCLIITIHCHTILAVEQSSALFSISNIKPWGYEDDKASLKGLLFKTSNALEAETGIKIINQLRPYPRVIHNLKNGSIDFAIMFNSPQAKNIGISVGRIVDTKILLIALKGSEQVTNLAELSKKQVGYLRGSKYGAVFDDNKNIEKVSLDSMEQGIKMLLKKHLHAIVAADQTFYYALQKLEISTTEVVPIMVINETSGDLYFSKASKNTHLIEPFKLAVMKLHKKGILKNIFYNNDFMPKE